VLDPQALGLLRHFEEEVDRQAPGLLEGLYGVGSLALGDWRAGSSNLDVVAAAAQPWPEATVSRLNTAVAGLGPSGRPARVAFLSWGELAADPATVDAPVLEGRSPVPSAELVNPMTWQVLRISGICTRGPEYPEVGSGDVRDWAADRIVTRWLAQLEGWRRHPLSLWLRRRTAPAVLEVARLAVIASSGRVVSKLEAGQSLIDGARSSTQRILKDSVGYRQGSRVSMYWGPFERKRDVVNWVQTVVDRQHQS
jgi:hypothetical protein